MVLVWRGGDPDARPANPPKGTPVSIALRATLALLVLPTALVTLAGPASAATALPAPAPMTAAPVAPTQGIIMRDGGICDPIRHMGC
jgi:hypothetical protein